MAAGLMRLYVVYDHVAEHSLGFIQQCPTDGVAMRSFVELLQEGEEFKKHPQDYCLMFIGMYDPEYPAITEVPPHQNEVILEGRAVVEEIRRARAAGDGELELSPSSSNAR